MVLTCHVLFVLAIFASHSDCAVVKMGNDVKVILYTQPQLKGESFTVNGLNKIDDCKGVQSTGGDTDPPEFIKFNEKSQSISLGSGVCVRLFEHDCEWTTKGKILDTMENSTWVTNFALGGFNGIVSAVKLIECPPNNPPLVSLYAGVNHQGEKIDLFGLQKIGDFEALWSPKGYGVKISEHLRRFDNKARSIKIRDGVCVRIFEHDCEWTSKGKVLDTSFNSTWVSDLNTSGFMGILSCVKVVECPPVYPLVTLYTGISYTGEKIDLPWLQKVGDCQELSSTKGYSVMISEDLRRSDNKARSIQLRDGVCVRLFEHDCDWNTKGKILDTMQNSSWIMDVNLAGMNGIISAVKIVDCPRQALVRVYSGIDRTGDIVDLFGLQKIGDCEELSSSRGYNVIISENLRRFDNKPRSIQLNAGICVRLFEHDCDWNTKGKILDTTPNSTWVTDFAYTGMSGMISGIQIIECPPSHPPLVSLYTGIYLTGERLDLPFLREIGDCEELWSPFGMNVMMSEHLRRFDNKINSIQIQDGTCVRLYEHACDSTGKYLDTLPNSQWTMDLFKITFQNMISAVELIECPLPSRITVYSSTNFQGKSLELHGNSNATISEELRQFNDKMHSIKISPGLCVRLLDGHCGVVGKTLDNVTIDSHWARNLNRKGFGGKVSSVEFPLRPLPLPLLRPNR